MLTIQQLGLREWQKQSGYSQRSMVENTAYRYKDDPRRRHAETMHERATSGGADWLQDSQPNGTIWTARQLQS